MSGPGRDLAFEEPGLGVNDDTFRYVINVPEVF